MDMHGHAANVHNLSGRHAQFVRWRCTISCGILKIKTKHFTQRQTLMPGMSIYYDDEDGYTTIIEYIGPYEMYHNSYKRT